MRPDPDAIVREASAASGVTPSPEWQALLKAIVQAIISAVLRRYGG